LVTTRLRQPRATDNRRPLDAVFEWGSATAVMAARPYADESRTASFSARVTRRSACWRSAVSSWLRSVRRT